MAADRPATPAACSTLVRNRLDPRRIADPGGIPLHPGDGLDDVLTPRESLDRAAVERVQLGPQRGEIRLGQPFQIVDVEPTLGVEIHCPEGLLAEADRLAALDQEQCLLPGTSSTGPGSRDPRPG